MIAEIAFHAGKATLTDDGRWQAPEPYGDALNVLLDTTDRSPSAGAWRTAHVAAMARLLGGKVTKQIIPRRPPRGRVF